ncbi:hypothetical protein U5G49_005195 (plasmid) [Rhizobium indigoferae]|uniref:Uncharacterized protein n=1 Tax=Rhizobium indigoferae TaxID=158891 RepID=A0ABZ1DUC4_9HYPH|nr:hypothetical protein [Rhizobium indigoferae]WRW39838.1 hypothetical protein U5G49_005195 [Rhizobium indigoferae]
MFAIRERGYDISREMAEMGGMRPGYRNQQKKSVLFKAPGLFIGALAFGAAGGWTASDLLASWSGSGGSGQSCKIKGNVSIATGEKRNGGKSGLRSRSRHRWGGPQFPHRYQRLCSDVSRGGRPLWRSGHGPSRRDPWIVRSSFS